MTRLVPVTAAPDRPRKLWRLLASVWISMRNTVGGVGFVLLLIGATCAYWPLMLIGAALLAAFAARRRFLDLRTWTWL